MRRLALAKCGNLTESLMEGLMTDSGLTEADKQAMNDQITAIEEVSRDVGREQPDDAAYYGSYILSDAEQRQIKTLFPQYPNERPPRRTDS